MKPFTRTQQGVANYKIFFGVDMIFFCEGGLSNEHNFDREVTADELFWRPLIVPIVGRRTYRVHACGDKGQVLQQVRMSVIPPASDSGDAYGCIDRDYDDLDAIMAFQQIKHRMLVTQGYSIENDLLHAVTMERVLSSLLPRMRRTSLSEVLPAKQKLERHLLRLSLIDLAFRRRGLAFLPTDGDIDFVKFSWKNRQLHYTFDVAKYRAFRRGRLRKAGVRSFSDLRALPIVKQCTLSPHQMQSGLLACPGKLIFNIIRRYANAVGENLSKWQPIGSERFYDFILSTYLLDKLGVTGE